MSETTPTAELTAETIEEIERKARGALESVETDWWTVSEDSRDLLSTVSLEDLAHIAACSPVAILKLVNAARLAAERGERIRELEAELAELRRSPSLLRPAVVVPALDLKDPETAAKLARGAAIHRSLREPCTVHNLDADGICIKCDRRIAPRVP